MNSGSGDFSITAVRGLRNVMGWGGVTNPGRELDRLDPTQIFIRTSNPLSGTEGMIASAIGLPPSRWLATLGDAGAAQMLGKGGQVQTALETTTSPKAALGIISAAVVDPNKGAAVLDGGVVTKGGLRPLAFQASGQDCGLLCRLHLASAFDKINIRQGRYVIWGAHHWITNVTASDASTPTPVGVNGNSAAVATVINHLMHQNILAPVDQAMIAVEAETYDVPRCAMQVSRTAEVTASGESGESSYQPTKGCGCYFESVANGASPDVDLLPDVR